MAAMEAMVTPRHYARWRVGTLVGVHLLFIAHFIHWKLKGRTLAPLEFNEVLYTVHQGIVTAGFVLMAIVMAGTLVFGRFFCSWGCHILALQDAAGWILDKLHIKRQPVRSRTLIWIPMGVMFYLFIWPQLVQAFDGTSSTTMHLVEAGGSRWSSFTTDDLWRNLPPPGVAVSTFFVCGFVIVYLLGSRGFCFQACPYGALFSIADQVAPGRIVLAKDCSQCGLCTKACSSDIMVHRELAVHGMVINPRCLKDLDCVAACPEEAVQYGFRKPPLFGKGHPMGGYAGRFSTTLHEDLFMAGVFLLAMPIFRGLYDLVPFLLAVALSACTSYLLLIGWRLLRRNTVQLRGSILKMDGAVRPAGVCLCVVCVVLMLSLAHSGLVQYHTLRGRQLFQRIAGNGPAMKDIARAIASYDAALDIGLLRPLDRRMELASLLALRGDTARAGDLLTGILNDRPDHTEALYRLGRLAHANGDMARAMKLWTETLERGRDRSGSASREAFQHAALELGKEWTARGDLSRALAAYQKGLQRAPGSGSLLIAQGTVEHRSGRIADAIAHFEEALRIDGPSPVAHNNLGALYLQQGRTAAAIGQFRLLADLMPGDANVRYTLGILHARSGRPDLAFSYLTVARQLAPSDGRIVEALAQLDAGHQRTRP